MSSACRGHDKTHPQVLDLTVKLRIRELMAKTLEIDGQTDGLVQKSKARAVIEQTTGERAAATSREPFSR
jgi:hypothetical protein